MTNTFFFSPVVQSESCILWIHYLPTKHGVRSGTPASGQDMASATPTIPSGLKPPQPLKTEGNLATNWKHFKRTWGNYAIVARLERFDEKFKTAMFLSVIGEDALEMFHGTDFTPETDR